MKRYKLIVALIGLLSLSGYSQKTYLYSGTPVSLTENKLTVTPVGDLLPEAKTGFQGMAIHNDWLISLEHSGVATIYTMNGEKLTRKGCLKLGSHSMSNHCNSANFSHLKAQSEDELPLLYVSRCNTEKMADGLDRIAFVERIDPIGMKSELVQRIYFNTSPKTITGNTTWAIDKENGMLISLTNTLWNKGVGNKHLLVKFHLPQYRGPQDSLVVLTLQDAVEEYYLEDYYNKPFSPIMQGLNVKNNLLFIPVGVGTKKEPSYLYIWNLAAHCMQNEINLQEAIPSELEDSDYRNGSIYLQTQSMGIQRIDFIRP